MINFSGISPSSLLGRALRVPLRLIPGDAEVRILQGPLRGKRWIAGSSIHACWLGSYEMAKQSKVCELVRRGMVCWDVGAHVGFYTLLFADLVGPGGRVLAFEPLPRNVELLRRHVGMNGYRNVRVFPCALLDCDGQAEFDPGPTTSMGRIASGGCFEVACRAADSLCAAGEVDGPDVIKIDVEGAEAQVLAGASELLCRRRPVLFLATHGVEPHRASLDLLAALGYEVSGVNGEGPHQTDELLAVPGGSRRGRQLAVDKYVGINEF